jgi:hypothetical protein
MRLFLDTSVLLAASGSTRGASRENFRLAPVNRWQLLATPYVVEETVRNLPMRFRKIGANWCVWPYVVEETVRNFPTLPLAASTDWIPLRNALVIRDDVLTLDRPAVFPVTKDRPILFSALAWADVLLTLDRNDFAALLGR